VKFPVTIRVYIGFGLLFLLSATIGISSFFVIKKQQKISISLSHTDQVLNTTDDILTLLTDMESSRRGLRCTHQNTYLESYYVAKEHIGPKLNELSALTSLDTEQAENITSLNRHIGELSYFWSTLRKDEQRYDSTEIAGITQQETALMSSVKAITKEIIKVENNSLAKNKNENDKTIALLSWLSPAGAIVEQLILLVLIYLVICELRKRKKAESELLKNFEKEKQLNELKSRFITMASHEFRTPLASILASTYLAAKYKTIEGQEKREKHYDRIASAVHNLTEILEDLLSVDKLEVGKVQVHLREVNIGDHIDLVVNDITMILKPGQKIIYEKTGQETAILDPVLLKHILTNLLSNSIKFSKDDGVICINSYHNGRQVMISVKDHGIGIPKTDLDHLYERFHRAANVTNIEGTGIGLNIVANYSKLMGGTIKCISDEGIGTEFILTFPQVDLFDDDDVELTKV
jgi:signal transduction histidine kinase